MGKQKTAKIQERAQDIQSSFRLSPAAERALARFREEQGVFAKYTKLLAPWGAANMSLGRVWQDTLMATSQALTSPLLEVSRTLDGLSRTLDPLKSTLTELKVQRFIEAIDLRPFAYLQQQLNLTSRLLTPHIWIPRSLNLTLGRVLASYTPTFQRFFQLQRQVAEWARRLPYVLCGLALQALEEGDTQGVEAFFTRYLDLPNPTQDHYIALWKALKSGKWRQASNPLAYVKFVVWKEGQRAKSREEITHDWRNLLTPRDKTGVHLDKGVSVICLYGPDGEAPFDIPTLEPGFEKVESEQLLAWAFSQLPPSEQEALAVYLTTPNWRKVGRVLYGDAYRGKVVGQRVKRHLRSLLLS